MPRSSHGPCGAGGERWTRSAVCTPPTGDSVRVAGDSCGAPAPMASRRFSSVASTGFLGLGSRSTQAGRSRGHHRRAPASIVRTARPERARARPQSRHRRHRIRATCCVRRALLARRLASSPISTPSPGGEQSRGSTSESRPESAVLLLRQLHRQPRCGASKKLRRTRLRLVGTTRSTRSGRCRSRAESYGSSDVLG